jgi:catechol 2,3-dioxygenase-like lactoylglutathione lyase family enzyme
MQIAYVNIFVSDLARAVAFYHEKLGLPLQFASPEHGYASLAAGTVRLGLGVPGPNVLYLDQVSSTHGG